MGKIIIVGNQKGGSYKTTLSMMFAGYLHNKKKKKILVIDTDSLQKSFTRSRERAILYGEKETYQVINSNPIDIPELIDNVIDDFDYIFIDLPGNLIEDGVLSCYMYVDYLITPTSCTDLDLDSTALFLDTITKKIIPKREEAGIDTKMIGVVVKTNKKGIYYKDFIENYNKGLMPIPFFKEVIPHSEVLDAEVDTVNNVTYINKSFHVGLLYKEFAEFLNI